MNVIYLIFKLLAFVAGIAYLYLYIRHPEDYENGYKRIAELKKHNNDV